MKKKNENEYKNKTPKTNLDSNILWKERKRWTFFALPFTFTKYTLLKDKLLVDTGFLNQKQEEVRLYRIMDITLTRTLFQRIFGVGTITFKTLDKTTPVFECKNITKSQEIKELFSTLVEQERVEKRVGTREFLVSDIEEDIEL